jgi:hypothetical protein
VTTVEVFGLVATCLLFVGALAAFGFVVLHQRRLIRMAGALPVAVKLGDKRWSNGVGRYAGNELIWYRTLTLSPAAALRMPRNELQVVASRPWDANRDMALRPNLMIVECRFRGEQINLGFPDNGLTGFLSWLEASAPRF